MDTKTQKRRSRAGRPTTEQAEQRHQELLDRALEIFLKNGYELTTIDGIAAKMRMTKRTIYGLYPNKEALFKAIAERAIAANTMPIEHLRALETDDLEATLVAVARVRVESFLSPSGMRMQRVINAESYRFPELLMLYYVQSTGSTVKFLTDLLLRHAERGDLVVERPEATAAIFLSMAVGAPGRGMLTGNLQNAENLDDYIAFTVRLFLNGIKRR